MSRSKLPRAGVLLVVCICVVAVFKWWFLPDPWLHSPAQGHEIETPQNTEFEHIVTVVSERRPVALARLAHAACVELTTSEAQSYAPPNFSVSMGVLKPYLIRCVTEAPDISGVRVNWSGPDLDGGCTAMGHGGRRLTHMPLIVMLPHAPREVHVRISHVI